jgi:hypothetical protein
VLDLVRDTDDELEAVGDAGGGKDGENLIVGHLFVCEWDGIIESVEDGLDEIQREDQQLHLSHFIYILSCL